MTCVKGKIPKDMVVEPVEQDYYLCNGKFVHWKGKTVEIKSTIRVTETEGTEGEQFHLGSVPVCGVKEALECMEAASEAFNHGLGEWPTMTTKERIDCMEKFTRMMMEQREKVVRLIMWEICKNRKDAEKEFDRTVEYIQSTIESLKDLDRVCSRPKIESGILAQVRRAPLGVVLCMGPFNYPLNETFCTLIPAIIMGCTVIVKPAKIGVLLMEPLLTAFRDAFPPGVVNVIYGRGRVIAEPIMASGKVNVLAFIGTSRVANVIKKHHPQPHRLRCALGLDAKNPGLILPNADLDVAVQECLLGSTSFNGQRCTALKILFVHESIVDDFLLRFGKAVDELSCGLPWEDCAITPLAEGQKKIEWLQSLIEEVVSAGGRIVNKNTEIRGSLMRPHVVFPVRKGQKLWNEEQFGPVIPIASYKDVQEVVDYVVESEFGQQLSIFGTDHEQIGRLVDPLVNQVCRVNVNCQCQRGPDVLPFTGRKNSAEGTLSVFDALRVFSIRTLVASKMTPENKDLWRKMSRERKSKFLSTDFIL